MRAEGHSIRGIARAVGCDPATVRADLAVLLGQRLGPLQLPTVESEGG